ncbi:hypothetical protein BB987_02495 [Photorhabdus temperata]|uniref:Uncharacterized protein n=1 Tax=Photorhabdus khanii NC19 TaxID=1004151 RepID=W3V3Y2_9GAMM|nr:hypothetical protein PTE_04197 [Photorhabdus khanii NC19]OHV50237.1 hypothetical protein BB987_02495 [Photorhabdus temperata]
MPIYTWLYLCHFDIEFFSQWGLKERDQFKEKIILLNMMYPENTRSIQEKVQFILDRPFETFEPICLLPVMPKSDFSVVSRVLEYEKIIRRSELSLSDINQLPLDEYWIEILRLFKVNIYFLSGESVPDMLIESVHPFYRSFY